jgi:molecular chaperone Hsp33
MVGWLCYEAKGEQFTIAMEKQDLLYRGLAYNGQFRFFAVDTTETVQQALSLHLMTPAPTLLLGRLLTAALLMGADIKSDTASLTLNIEAEGPLKGAIAIYEPTGKVRGYAKHADYFDEVVANNWQLGKLLGKGMLTIIRDLKLKAPVTGSIELVSGEVAEDIASYYLQSEQTPTAISLGVLFDSNGKIRSAGGYLIQQMPDADPADAEKLMSNLANTPYITDLLDMGMAWQDIMGKMLFKDMDWSVTDTLPVSYQCTCSKERFAAALRLLGKDELVIMQAGIAPVCHYCNTEYKFTSEDIRQIIASLQA